MKSSTTANSLFTAWASIEKTKSGESFSVARWSNIPRDAFYYAVSEASRRSGSTRAVSASPCGTEVAVRNLAARVERSHRRPGRRRLGIRGHIQSRRRHARGKIRDALPRARFFRHFAPGLCGKLRRNSFHAARRTGLFSRDRL